MEDDEKVVRMFFATIVVIFALSAVGLALNQWHEADVRKACIYKTGNPDCKKDSN